VPFWYVLVAGPLALMIGIVITFVYVVQSSKDQRSATCDLVNANRAEKHAQLQAFDEAPPTTSAGKNIQKAYRESLARWDGLWNTLRCKEATDGS
jgi:hypothetical protein